MCACLPFRQGLAIDGRELVFGQTVSHHLGFGHFDLNDRAFARCGVDVQFAMLIPFQQGFIFIGCDHRLIGCNARLTVHRERVGIGMRSQRCRIDGQRLILVFELEILLQRPRIHRLVRGTVSAILIDLQIPPPLFNRV